ncbi:sensor histidine kinase [Flindersiella endophytica]
MTEPMSGPISGPSSWWRRSRRDWLADVTVSVVAAGAGVALIFFVRDNNGMSDLRFVLEFVAVAASCLLLFVRRRWPVPVAVVTLLVGLFSAGGVPAGMVMLFAIGVYQPARVAIGFAVVNLVLTAISEVVRPDPNSSFWEAFLWAGASTLVLVAWGMVIRTRRELVRSLRDRAERAEAEQRLLAEQARHAERSRIAREMHDVLAHRISLIALQAGGLEVRPDLPPGEVESSAQLIRSTARHALEELRDVIGVLRDGPGGNGPSEVPNAPQPALRDIQRLVDDGRRAGANVTLTMAVDEAEAAPGALGRAAYRIVQEALTNVNKHARGTETTVRVAGGVGKGLRVTVRNRLPVGRRHEPPLPGSGRGLVGLAERVTLVGGTLSHGPTLDGAFMVDAKLEWSA